MSNSFRLALLFIGLIIVFYASFSSLLLRKIDRLELQNEQYLIDVSKQNTFQRSIFQETKFLKEYTAQIKIPEIKFTLPFSGSSNISINEKWPQNSNPETSPDFRDIITPHFRICSYNQELLNFISSRIELYYNNIVQDLGLYEASFPLKQIQVYIFRDRKQYHNSTNNPPWSGGFASYENMSIYSFEGRHLSSTIPHELTHLVFHRFLEDESNIKDIKYLNEGIAVFEEMRANDNLRRQILCFLSEKYKNGMNIPFLNLLKPESLNYETTNAVADLWYAQVGGIIDFLINEKGRNNFVNFCRILKEYKDPDEALRIAYSNEFNNFSDIETKFIEYVKRF